MGGSPWVSQRNRRFEQHSYKKKGGQRPEDKGQRGNSKEDENFASKNKCIEQTPVTSEIPSITQQNHEPALYPWPEPHLLPTTTLSVSIPHPFPNPTHNLERQVVYHFPFYISIQSETPRFFFTGNCHSRPSPSLHPFQSIPSNPSPPIHPLHP